MQRPALHALFALSLCCASVASADDMDQGEARITTRSDVTMEIDSGPRTSGVKLNALAQHLGTPLGSIKRCYASIIKEDPSVHGQMDVTLTHPPKGRVRVQLEAGDVRHPKLKRCVRKIFSELKLNDVDRPASAIIKLKFDNSAADAAHHVEAKREEMAQVDVKTNDEGKRYSEDRTADGKVHFRIFAMGRTGDEAIAAAHHGLERALPRLLDCRRRSAKRASPAGEIHFNVALRKRGKPTIDAISSTVEHQWAKSCSQGALRRSKFDPAFGRVRVIVTFGD